VRLLRLGPGEWLAISDAIAGPTLEDRLRRHVGGQNIAAVDLSCALKALRVDGLAARELLAKGCGLDLHPNFFPAGRATRTRLAQLAVIVDCVDPTSRFDLYVGRSYLTWLRSWLVDASAS
jgi:sarcosine oxidase subunit gamma